MIQSIFDEVVDVATWRFLSSEADFRKVVMRVFLVEGDTYPAADVQMTPPQARELGRLLLAEADRAEGKD